MHPAFCPDIHTSTPGNIMFLAVGGLVIGLAFSTAAWQIITREGISRFLWLIPIAMLLFGTADIHFDLTSPAPPRADPDALLGEVQQASLRLGVWLLYSGLLLVILAMSTLWLIERLRERSHKGQES
ncbi:hypothetical protein [Nitratireductor basaltis]|uniref:hypothetical protein n=1 Tax=Nitratireductor basaltis TaxID=472175 RepID=UPI000569DDCF|nr:hypothetical protein [Nitratireductor basaltis]